MLQRIVLADPLNKLIYPAIEIEDRKIRRQVSDALGNCDLVECFLGSEFGHVPVLSPHEFFRGLRVNLRNSLVSSDAGR